MGKEMVAKHQAMPESHAAVSSLVLAGFAAGMTVGSVLMASIAKRRSSLHQQPLLA